MERTTLKAAADALAASARIALQCVAQVEVLNSGWAHGAPNSLRVVSSRAASPGAILLRRSDRSPFLHLRVDLEYAVIFDPGDAGRLRYRAAVTRYVFRVLDLDDHELFAFHWHPVGVSDVRTRISTSVLLGRFPCLGGREAQGWAS